MKEQRHHASDTLHLVFDSGVGCRLIDSNGKPLSEIFQVVVGRVFFQKSQRRASGSDRDWVSAQCACLEYFSPPAGRGS